MKAPIGAVVALYYDATTDVAIGDALLTPTGRTYLVVACRRQIRGKNAGRWHLRCVVAEAPPEGVVVHPLSWYSRDGA